MKCVKACGVLRSALVQPALLLYFLYSPGMKGSQAAMGFPGSCVRWITKASMNRTFFGASVLTVRCAAGGGGGGSTGRGQGAPYGNMQRAA